MHIEHTISLYTNESLTLFKKITIGKREPKSLFDSCIRKISALLAMAKNGAVYQLCKLYEIKTKIDSIQEAILEEISKSEELLKENSLSLDMFSFNKLDELTIIFGNPLIYEMAKLVEKFDYLIRLLGLIKNTGLKSVPIYFQTKEKYWRSVSQLITEILQIQLQVFFDVSIEDYLNCTEKYQGAVLKLGEIQPHVLNFALNLNFLPYIGEDKITAIQLALREKVKINRL